jgi:hypothetical protein
LDDTIGSFARPEAGDLGVLGYLAGGALFGIIQRFGLNLNGELHLVIVLVLLFDVQCRFPS